MAERIVTPAGKFCSSCGSAVEPAMELCVGCGQPFEAELGGTTCPGCGRAVASGRDLCPLCGANLAAMTTPEAADAQALPAPFMPPADMPAGAVPEDRVLDKLLEFPERSWSETAKLGGEPMSLPAESEAHLLAELESLWKLSEPFEKVVTSRRKRLEQMDRLIAGARRRIRELNESDLPEEVREREELKRQLAQVLQERDEILKIEYGITEMERIYRNIITIQQKELRSKEDALKARLEGFRKEIEVRDAGRRELADKEKGLTDRQEELEAREKAIAERLVDLAARERQSEVDPRPAERRGSEGVTREEWLQAQREIQDSLLTMRGAQGEAGLVPSATTARDLRVRVNELEEQIEKAAEEKARIERELADVRGAYKEVREVLKVLDDLLGKLPDKVIREFARSEAFKQYERLMERLGL